MTMRKGLGRGRGSGYFKGIRKGTICNFGQIVGGTKQTAFVRNWSNVRLGIAVSKIGWLSHGFKTHEVTDGIHPNAEALGILPDAL